MVTLKRLNLRDTEELHRRLGKRWRHSVTAGVACRRYRLMCRVFIAAHELAFRIEAHRVHDDMMAA